MHRGRTLLAVASGLLLLHLVACYAPAPHAASGGSEAVVCDALASAIADVHATGAAAEPVDRVGSRQRPARRGWRQGVRLVRHGGHKSVYAVKHTPRAIAHVGRVVLKAPLQTDAMVAGRSHTPAMDTTVAAEGGVATVVAPGDALVEGLSRASGYPLSAAQAEIMADHLRGLFASSSPASPLRAMDTDRDGHLSDAELAVFAQSTTGLVQGGSGSGGGGGGGSDPARSRVARRSLPTSAGSGAQGTGAQALEASDAEVEWWNRLAGSTGESRSAAAKLVPVVFARCGNVTVVEQLASARLDAVIAWPDRLALVVKLVGYLAELARVPRIGPLYACDQHSDNFGVDGAGHLKLLDVDALFTAQDLARHRKNSCIDDWECSFPTGLGVNIHHFCLSHLSVNASTGALGDVHPVGVHNVVGDVPSDVAARLLPLLRRCSDPEFASATDEKVEQWVQALGAVAADGAAGASRLAGAASAGHGVHDNHHASGEL